MVSPVLEYTKKLGMKPERGNLVRKDGLIRKDTSSTSIELDKSQALKGTAILCTGLESPRGFQEDEAPRFHDSRPVGT